MKRILIGLSMCVAWGAFASGPVSQGAPFDLAIANEAKLIEMLKKSGKIEADATLAEAEAALKRYLIERKERSQLHTQDLNQSLVELQGEGGARHRFQKLKQAAAQYRETHGAENCPDRSWHTWWRDRYELNCVEEETYTGEKRTARILSILIEFPDFPHNSILPGETEMFYEDYSIEHFESLLYGAGGYSGPNGENLISVIDYYEAQSGNSYSIEGAVAGWYMASQPAAYYGNNTDGNDRALVAEALSLANADPNINLEDFDQEDRFDLDGDGDLWEPDGLVDHVQVFHSSVGEEAGGGQLGEDAIWSHRWNLGGVLTFEGTSTDAPYWGGLIGAYDYTMQPIDAAAGVVAHEYGHDLGLPDEYDTQYSGRGEPVASWSIMSTGSWAGAIPGSEPTGFSAWSKEFLQSAMGGNWLTGTTYHLDELGGFGELALLDRASTKGTNNDVVRIDLPDKEVVVTTPTSGEYAYFSGKGNDLFNVMSLPVDLSDATTATLDFKAWLDIELDWDYAYVAIDGIPIVGNITTNTNPNGNNFGNGITGTSGDWIDAQFDLSSYAGSTVVLEFYYVTDSFVEGEGLYVDDVVISTDQGVLVSDDVESTPTLFTLDGFSQSNGKFYYPHYYLTEWRAHHGVDEGLAHVRIVDQFLTYNEGLLVWYVDTSYDDNWVGFHPGDGFLGVVDADQKVLSWSDGEIAATRYQVHDAAFNITPSEPVFLDFQTQFGFTLTDDHVHPVRKFHDRRSYISEEIPDAGRLITPYGLKIRVIKQSPDKSVGLIHLRN